MHHYNVSMHSLFPFLICILKKDQVSKWDFTEVQLWLT